MAGALDGMMRGREGQSSAPSESLLLVIAVAAALASALLILWWVEAPLLSAGFFAAVIALAGLGFFFRRLLPRSAAAAEPVHDWTLLRETAEAAQGAVAITDKAGRMVCANDRFAEWFDGYVTPPGVPLDGRGGDALTSAGRIAWRDGRGEASGLRRGGNAFDATVVRAGQGGDYLIWRFTPVKQQDLVADIHKMLGGVAGDRLSEAGIMAMLVGGEGRLRVANRGFLMRAAGREDASVTGRDAASFLRVDEKGLIFFAREEKKATPLRLLQIPIDDRAQDGPTLIMLLDEQTGIVERGTALSYIENLLSTLPLGLAMAARDGRLLFVNDAFARVAGLNEGEMPVYPGDMMVQEDRAAVADAVRRYASGQPRSGDIAVRLKAHGDEPVALGMAGVRGMGEAAVLLSLKDNSEESKLKRQVAQATKMQAVGQLAGGVAHDFNNILTAIIGHCDLMAMRHTPGDSDYEDIQQIRSNSNRAASLTRQLLAFSRQQTLRPQILQLPDVVSEVSILLKRLIGERITLEVHHGRGIGAVRADPGQLEQVIVNLAVNARDAMPGGGTLTIRTFPVSADEARALRSEIMPPADYAAFSIADTGTGIPPDVLSKIFEPFFTTKEVGKGTGLGLSTVYGIVKQSGGFIFADSEPGKGATFTVYLPVHAQARGAVVAPVKEPVRPRAETWGTGTILIVEDEDMVRNVAERALTRQGYTILTAPDGEQALEILDRNEPIDLLVSDVVMPVMDGPTMVRKARRSRPDIPVLFMSGYAEEQLRRSIDIDNIAFLPKPFSVAQLADAVREVLGKSA